jgi:DNA-binding NtrC family response regulator
MIEEFINLNMVGNSIVFQDVIGLIKKIANCDAPVLIEGETGTGKEVVARAIHYLSARRQHPFIPVNCGAIPDNLIENELFGHEKGAYTDAKKEQSGLVDQADYGTLFLDEVEALSAKGQVVLLRFFQDQQYTPLGSNRQKQAHVRIVAASNASLSKLVEQGLFRQDLLFRINIIPVLLPPLRERAEDIKLLAIHFLDRYQAQYKQQGKFFDSDTLSWMESYHWPGNVRELENIIHRALLLSEGPAIEIRADPVWHADEFNNTKEGMPNSTLAKGFNELKAQAIAEFEQRYLCGLIEQSGGNVTQAAKFAGKERRALGKLLKKYGIDKYHL